MEVIQIIQQLKSNATVFNHLLCNQTKASYLFRPNKTSWCNLEIIAHLVDEEKEDFRARIKYIIEQIAPHDISPETWPIDRNYINKDFKQVLNEFVLERNLSIQYLNSLSIEDWNSTFNNSITKTNRSTRFYLKNWLAHDFLHIRQIIKNNYFYLKSVNTTKVEYAGLFK